jgi:tetratricopeptide (TPR) repeat protein
MTRAARVLTPTAVAPIGLAVGRAVSPLAVSPLAAILAVTLAVSTVAITGCSSKAQQLRADIQEYNSERTPDKLVARGRAFAVVGDTTRAEQYYAAALEAGASETEIVPILVEVCIRDGRYRAAVEYAGPYVKRHPGDLRMRYVLGTLYQGIGDARSAREHLEAVVGKSPDQPEPHYALAILLRDDVSDLVAADDQFKEYLRLAPNGPHADEARALLMKAVR